MWSKPCSPDSNIRKLLTFLGSQRALESFPQAIVQSRVSCHCSIQPCCSIWHLSHACAESSRIWELWRAASHRTRTRESEQTIHSTLCIHTEISPGKRGATISSFSVLGPPIMSGFRDTFPSGAVLTPTCLENKTSSYSHRSVLPLYKLKNTNNKHKQHFFLTWKPYTSSTGETFSDSVQ